VASGGARNARAAGLATSLVPVAVGLATAACVLVAVLRPVIRDEGDRAIRLQMSVFRLLRLSDRQPSLSSIQLLNSPNWLPPPKGSTMNQGPASLSERFEAEREVAMMLNRYGKW